VHSHRRNAESQFASFRAARRKLADAAATFRTKIFLTLADDFSAKPASELCGREDRLKVSYNLSESGHDARVSLLTGNALSHRANMKVFTELRNARSVVIAYDGLNPMPPCYCYLKPYYNDPNKSYFQQLEEGVL
jgi:hypothetical protein